MFCINNYTFFYAFCLFFILSNLILIFLIYMYKPPKHSFGYV